MTKEDIFKIIDEVTKSDEIKCFENTNIRMVSETPFFCGDFLVQGISVVNGDIRLYDEDTQGISAWDECTFKHLKRLAGRLIAFYVNGELMGQDDEHYEWLVDDWYNKHVKQFAYVVTSISTRGNNIVSSLTRLFCLEKKAFEYFTFLVEEWTRKNVYCNTESSKHINKGTNDISQDFYGYGEEFMVHYSLNKTEIE